MPQKIHSTHTIICMSLSYGSRSGSETVFSITFAILLVFNCVGIRVLTCLIVFDC